MKTKIPFTHKNLVISDIRKITKANNTYANLDISYMIKFEDLAQTFYLPASVFESTIEKYLLTKDFNRNDILNLKFNAVITPGYYIKYNSQLKEYSKVPGIYAVAYLNFLSIDSGRPLDLDAIHIETNWQETTDVKIEEEPSYTTSKYDDDDLPF
jgi:hypothetical protein